MKVDPFTKTVLSVIAVALLLIAVNLWITPDRLISMLAADSAEAQASREAKYVVGVPKAWGKVVGYGAGNIWMEASDGTLREIDVRGKPPEYPIVKSQVKWE